MSSINHNLMAANTAGNLQSHYSRLSTSVRRLASGLRINSAADDAAGLASRELMRADIAALNQGMRNASDAVSMLQTADGALAVIDEKLIRMKELAEQAATGTYDSTQRLIIASEYQEMAAEIDRIARATDFNGIKLLDGSLSGKHDGSGLNAKGAMKIHFGTANDTAEDYYYVQIGACTTEALGLNAIGGAVTVIREEVVTVEETQMSFQFKGSYNEYTDPVTGKKYYTDGDYFFADVYNPGKTALNWETDREIIERLEMKQETKKSYVSYAVFTDPMTNLEYFTRDGAKTFTSDPYDPEGKVLHAADPGDKAILDRLTASQKSLRVETIWYAWKNPDGKMYYTCDGGLTFAANVNSPAWGMLDSTDPAHKQQIDALERVMVAKTVPVEKRVDFTEYYDPVTSHHYYCYKDDDGKDIYVSWYKDPFNTALDPVGDKELIDRLLPVVNSTYTSWTYDTYMDPATNILLYTMDGGKTFVSDITDPFSIVNKQLSDLEMVIDTTSLRITCSVYEDPGNGGKRYFSSDKGKTFFDDLSNPDGSIVDTSDPANAAIIAGLQKVDSVVIIESTVEVYFDYVEYKHYYTRDGGKTFLYEINFAGGEYAELDISNPDHKLIYDRILPIVERTTYAAYYDIYLDPADRNKKYYTRKNGAHDLFITDLRNPRDIALDASNAADKAIIDRLVPDIKKFSGTVEMELPGKAYIYVDETTNRQYYSWDGGQSFSDYPDPYFASGFLDPAKTYHKNIIDRLKPLVAASKVTISYIDRIVYGEGGGGSISTQAAAQSALVSIDRAIVSKDKIRAHLGALQNRLENTITNLSIQSENLQSAESRISDADIALEMTQFVRNQIFSQAATAMLGQANSFPHMMMNLIG